KKTLARKTKNFEIHDGEIYENINGFKRKIICRHEIELRNNIIKNLHKLDHVGTYPTYKRVAEKFIGISFLDVKEFIDRCSNCIRDTLPNIIPSITPILPDFVRERLIVVTIDLSSYREFNDDYICVCIC
ncbi:hypothetical protein DMUE_5223, partial [Dictyocoela muelleri]